MATLHSDKEKLELIFLKLGLAETDDDLEKIINTFLAYILSKLSSTESNIRTKVLEMLTHLNKRLKSRESVKLPVHKLLTQLNDTSCGSFVTNFSIIYIKMGFPRLSGEDRINLSPLLFASIEGKAKNQQDILMRLLAETLPLIKLDKTSSQNKIFEFSSHTEGTKLLLDFFLDILMMPYSVRLQEIREASSHANSPHVIPPGLSIYAVKRLVGDANTVAWTLEQIEAIKMSILDLIKADMFNVNDVVCHLVVACSDTRHSVATNADLELRKQIGSIDWNDQSLSLKLYKIYLGPADVHAKKSPPDQKREAANIRMKLKLVLNMSRSTTIGECFPQSIQLVYDGLFGKTNAKLQALTLQFIHHILDKCTNDEILQKQAPLLLDAMQKISNNQDLSVVNRGLAYIGMGKLSQRTPELFRLKMNIVQSLFEALTKETSVELKSSIQETISVLAHAYKGVSDNHFILIESLVESSIADSDHHLRLAGVRYAGTIFATDHVPSRYQLMIAAGDVKEEVASQARKYLSGNISKDATTSKEEGKIIFPHFSSMLTFVEQKAKQRMLGGKKYVIGSRSMPFPPSTFQVILLYLRKCLIKNGSSKDNNENDEAVNTEVIIAKHVRETLKEKGSAEIHLISLYIDLMCQYLSVISDPSVVSLMLEIIASSPDEIPVQRFLLPFDSEEYDNPTVVSRVKLLKDLTNHTNEEIRQYAAEIYAIVVRRNSPSSSKYEGILCDLLDGVASTNYEVKHGSILLMGHIIGDWIKISQNQHLSGNEMETDDNNKQENINKAFTILVEMIENEKDNTLAGAACFAIGEIARKAPLPLNDGVKEDENSVDMEKEDGGIPTMVTKLHVLESLASRLTKNMAHKIREHAVVALGRLSIGEAVFPHDIKLLNELLKSSEINDTELHFSVGAALCSASLGLQSPERFNKWTGELESVDIVGGDDNVEWILQKILEEFVVHRTPTIRQASCIWLMVMLKTDSWAKHADVKSHLLELQNAFQTLLSEPNDLTQDIASKGFGIVYELADDNLKKVLVEQLVGSLTGTTKAAPSKVRIMGQEGSTLFQGASSQLGKAPDGSNISTYKELCSLASDLNQPDLVYKFLHLANHHAMWNTKKGAAFGFRSIALAAQEQLKPYLPSIVPRLYRYTFDPQPSIRSAMTSIWNVVATEPTKLIETYMNAILDDLVRNLTNNIWRTRQACCLALVDLLRGGVKRSQPGSNDEEQSSPDLIVSKLPELWSILFRVRDDIKESVRDAAADACKMLKKITVRLCDEVNNQVTGNSNLSEILSILLKDGLNSSVSEVRDLGFSTLVEISKVSGKLIKPCVAQMVVALLEALSSTEAPVINYLHNQSSEMTQSSLDFIRAQSVRTNPLMETAVRCMEQCDHLIMKDLAPALAELTKRGVGISTRAGCAHAITILVTSSGDDVTPYAGKLINALVSGLSDRSSTVRKIYSTAIGHMARVAKDATLEKLLKKMKQWYIEKDDEIAKHSSACVVYAIAQRCPDALNRHSSLVLPLAFYGMHESIPKDKQSQSDETSGDELGMSGQEMWQAIWNEFTPGFETAVRLYVGEIVDLCSVCLQSNNWNTKAQAAAAMSSMTKKQRPGTIVRPHLDNLLQALLKGLQGRTWDGKYRLLHALRDVCVHCHQEINQDELDMALLTLFKEGKREKASYRAEAISSLADSLHVHKMDQFADFWNLVQHLLVENAKVESDSEDEIDATSTGKSSKPSSWNLKEKILKSVATAWPVNPTPTHVEYYQVVLPVIAGYASHSTYSMQLSSFVSMTTMLSSLQRSSSSVPEEQNKAAYKNLCDIVISPICVGLVNLKFTSICEEALKSCEAFVDLIKGGQCHRSDRVMELHKSLLETPLNTSKSEHRDRITQLLQYLYEEN